MKLFAFGNNIRIVLAWFISYMLILFFTVFVNFIAYLQIEGQIVEQNSHYVTELLENRREELDNLRQLVGNIAVEISHNEAVNQLAFSTDSISGGNFYRVIEASEELSKYKTIEGDFNNIYVYFHKLDYCVGLNGSNAAASYYMANFSDRGIQHSAWVSLMRENHPGDFTLLSAGDGRVAEPILYTLSLYGTERFTPYATIVIEVDHSKFFPATVKESYNEAFYIIDKEGRALPSGDTAADAQVQEIVHQYGIPNGISTVGKQIMIAAQSGNSDWKYLYLVDKTEFQKSIYAARRQIILFNLLGIGAMVLVAYFFTRRNYRPVQKILNIFGSTDEVSKSEFRYIESRISDMVAQNQAYSKITEKLQDNVIRSAFLSRLLNERVPISNKAEILESLGLSFPHPQFIVVLFYIEINDEMFFDHQNDNTEEAYRLARLVLTNVLDDLLDGGETAEYCDVEGMLAGIVNLEKPEQADGFHETVQKLQKFLLSNFNIRFMAGLSNPYSSLDDLPKCYSEAMACMEQYFFSINDVVTYSELEHTELADCYISKNMEDQLVSGMKVGNYETCVRILDQIFVDNILGSGKSVQAVKFILYELTAIMIKTITEIGEMDDDDSEIAELISMVDNIGVNVDVREINRHLQSIIQRFCAKNVQKTVQKTDLLSERAKLFVDEHYMDSALTVAMIAENCNVSMAYLSTNFKKKYQTGLLEYINLVRIEHAKTILEKSSDTVERVAELVGYGNLRSFFRMFSRYVGTTPNRYRAMMLAKRKDTEHE